MIALFALALAAEPKIINGEDASADDFPMTGGAMMSADFIYQGRPLPLQILVCSSTLIAPDVVLLAGHCVDELAITQGQGTLDNVEWVWSRQADLSQWDGTHRANGWPDDAVPVAAWVENADFNLMRMQLGVATNNDIALLFLDEALTDNPLGYLPTREEAADIAEGDEVWIVGWGQQVATSGTQMPPAGTYAYKQMALTSLGEVGDAEIQVGQSEDAGRKCHGDSGGPTFREVQTDSTETMRVIGVTSHSYDMSDCDSLGGVDTRVDAYLDWIDAQMTAACEDGTRVWCDVPGILPAPAPEGGDTDATGSGDDGDTKSGAQACGCDSNGSGAWSGSALVLGLLALRRRASV